MWNNEVKLVGRLTRDPEIRHIPSGKALAKLSIAVSRSRDESFFVELVAWEDLAESVNSQFRKGDSVVARGRLVIREYEGKDGTKRKAVEIVCDSIEADAGPSKREPEPREKAAAEPSKRGSKAAAKTPVAASSSRLTPDTPDYVEDDELPF